MNPVMHRGFTLIELLVSMAIAVILLVLAAPGYGVWVADSEVQNAAQSLATGLRYAQSEAVKRNEKVQLVVDKTTGTGGWSAQLPDGTVLQEGKFAEGSARMTVVPAPAGLDTVTFTGLGQIDPDQCRCEAAIHIDRRLRHRYPARIR